jgi:hypothetical protein
VRRQLTEAGAMPDPIVDVDYRTHILIGVKASGSMTVICHWSHVPRQAEVQNQIGNAREPYARSLLCTPTSVLPQPDESDATRYGPFR